MSAENEVSVGYIGAWMQCEDEDGSGCTTYLVHRTMWDPRPVVGHRRERGEIPRPVFCGPGRCYVAVVGVGTHGMNNS